LFGMINWLFTWFQDDGALDYAQMARLVSDVVRGGLGHLGSGTFGVRDIWGQGHLGSE